MLVAAAVGPGCRGIEAVDVNATRESCGLDGSATWSVVADYAGISNTELTAGCAVALASDFGLEWSDEAGSPRHLQRYDWENDPDLSGPVVAAPPSNDTACSPYAGTPFTGKVVEIKIAQGDEVKTGAQTITLEN